LFLIIGSFILLGWRSNKTYFLATKNGTAKDDRYLISWVCIKNFPNLYFPTSFSANMDWIKLSEKKILRIV
jgi:hypothetical protein